MRVDVFYRPLRIGWAVRAGDIDSIRLAMKYSHALWGGRFNPIIIIDNEDEATQLIEKFRVDLIWPIGDSEEVKDFPKKFPHLKVPFHGKSIFLKDDQFQHHYAQVLDIANAMSHWHTTAEWKHIKDHGIRKYTWAPDDPLSDIFLCHLGEYPTSQEVGTDYLEMFSQTAEPIDYKLNPDSPIPSDIHHHASLSMFGQLGFYRHTSNHMRWDLPGFFVGSTSNTSDLVCHWNLRACDLSIWFIDPEHIDRYETLVPELITTYREMIEHRKYDLGRSIGIWSRDTTAAAKLFSEIELFLFEVCDEFWSRNLISTPTMHLGQFSTLGVMDDTTDTPHVNFGLTNKPFDATFYQQHLVASTSFFGLYGEEHYTFHTPYIPELNEFYSRAMHYSPDRLRVEPERIGVIIHTTENDSSLRSVTVSELLIKIFSMAGFHSQLSNSGRIVRQLMTQLGGLQGGRIFKIPGVRELIKKFGPRTSFSKRTAYTTIADKKQGSPATFPSHEHLYLSPRAIGTLLTPADVFSHMVDKGLFRIGIDVNCEKCGMESWVTLDVLKEQITCELCGHHYNATKQILNNEWAFRRSGILGAEKNIQGAIPVSLTLQQLGTTFDHVLSHNMYSPSMDLSPINDDNLPRCEVDFIWLINGQDIGPSDLIIAECKDKGPINPEDFSRDVENMRRVADSFPQRRFNTYILFVKLAPFTNEEINMARTLNGKYQNRVILLTARELEPYHIYERLKDEHEIKSYAAWPKNLADITQEIYFA